MHAVIDIGSNSVLLLLAARRDDGAIEIAEDRAVITRISQGAAESGRLSSEAIERTLDALTELRARAEAAGASSLTAVATEGVRMADNADAFLVPAARRLGAPVRTISGEEEARLSYRSVALEEPDGPLRVVDVGGASTELCVGHGLTVSSVHSHPVGAVRLTERHLVDPDAPTPSGALAAMAADVRAALRRQPLPPHPDLHGLAGTVTTLAAIALGLASYDRDRVHGSALDRTELEGLRDALAARTPAERCAAYPALSVKRADVIVAGATILVEVMRHCGAVRLCVRDRGLRYALVPTSEGDGA